MSFARVMFCHGVSDTVVLSVLFCLSMCVALTRHPSAPLSYSVYRQAFLSDLSYDILQRTQVFVSKYINMAPKNKNTL